MPTRAAILSALSWRQRATLLAHVFKAVGKQHHATLVPLLRRVIPGDGIVIDAGAHAGQFTKLFSRIAANGHVFAFEPGGYARLILTAAVRARLCRNVTIVPAALGAREETMRLALPLKPSGSLGFGLAHLGAAAPADDRTRCETVPVTTLDLFAARQGLARLDFVKADIEGWEMHMLAGAHESVSRRRPAVLLEVVASHLGRAGSAPREIWEFFAGHGYRAHRLQAGTLEPPTGNYETDGDYLFLP